MHRADGAKQAMRVLILGGTGFLGPPLVRRLVHDGHEVTVFHRGHTRSTLPPSARSILGDRRHLADGADELRRCAPEVVVDMIAFTEKDALGLLNTFRGLSQRTVVVSSADVYRAYGRFLNQDPGCVEPTPLDEDAPLRTVLFPYRSQAQAPGDFFSTYDKIPVERTVLADPALPGTVLRLPMVHGPGDPYRRLSPYLKRMDDRRPAIVLDEALARWKCPRGHVENVAAAIALAVVDDRAAGRIYNVAEPVAFNESEWIRAIGEVAGWRGDVVTVPRDSSSTPYRFEQSLDTDSSRIRRELGYVEAVAARESLEQTVAWERANPAAASTGIGLLDYETEDAVLAELAHTKPGTTARDASN
jgi:nucleoside-diphosphate-sugar epimerase